MQIEIFHIKDWLQKKRQIYLNKDNLEIWKREYDRLMLEYTDMSNYSSCLFDTQWIEDWEGSTPQEAVDEEISCF
jgi:hypothetical protein